MRSIAQNRFDRGRPRRRHHVADLLEIDGELTRPPGGAPAHPERDAHRRGHANRRRAAYHHGPDGASHFLRRAAPQVHLLAGQLALIDHHDRIILPIYRREHGRHFKSLITDRSSRIANPESRIRIPNPNPQSESSINP
jgi:hypothetical protein